MHHPQVLKSPIVNDCLEVNNDGHTEPELLPKLFVHMSIIELCNNLVSNTIYGGLKEAIDEGYNIIIGDSAFR